MRIFAAFIIAIAITACATITKGTTQIVAINTPGAGVAPPTSS
jgi:hypothetical protein